MLNDQNKHIVDKKYTQKIHSSQDSETTDVEHFFHTIRNTPQRTYDSQVPETTDVEQFIRSFCNTPQDIQIKDVDKRHKIQERDEELNIVKKGFKEYTELKSKISHLQLKRTKLLANSILPYVKEQLLFLKSVNSDNPILYQKAKKDFIIKITGDKSLAIAFMKKHLKNL